MHDDLYTYFSAQKREQYFEKNRALKIVKIKQKFAAKIESILGQKIALELVQKIKLKINDMDIRTFWQNRKKLRSILRRMAK